MSFLDIIILIPLFACVAMAFCPPASARTIALSAAGVNALLGLLVFFAYDRAEGGYQFVAERVFLTNPVTMGHSVGADGMAIVMILLSVFVTLAAIWMSPTEIKGGRDRMYYGSLMLISLGALGAFSSTDVFFFYAFHEVALIPTFLMIGIWGQGEDKKKAAWQITIYLAVGSIILLVGLIALYTQLPNADGSLTFSMPQLAANAEAVGGAQAIPVVAQEWIFLALLIGFGILISLFPFHSWAAPAYAAAPTPTTMLHAGVLKKFGLYGLLRLAYPLLPAGADHWQNLLLVLLLGNILFIGLVTISSRSLDQTLANSSVMHMGYIFLGLAAYNSIGWSGAVLLMFAHGVSIALLFGIAGRIREKAGTLEYAAMPGGLATKTPLLAVLFAFGAFAAIGLPGLANFSGEIMVFFGGFKDADLRTDGIDCLQLATILALWGVVISAVYMLRAYRRIFQGETKGAALDVPDYNWADRAPVILLVILLLLIGFFPSLFLDLKLPAPIELTK